MSSLTEIPNLVFSTASPTPRSGAEFVRQVIARSPRVAADAERAFTARADLAGAVAQSELAEPVYTFSRLSEEAWLLNRAVSLGLYRKGSHQLLVHGLVLGYEHLERLDGNPFLLDDPEVRAAGGPAFLAAHPGDGGELPPLALDVPAELCRRRNRERFAERFQELAAYEPFFPALFEAVVTGERLAIGVERPAWPLVEWLLLHLHPDDRLEVAFHTFYSHVRRVEYDLMLALTPDAARLRGQFRHLARIDLEGEPPAANPDGRGSLALRLCQRSVASYLSTVEEYRITSLSHRFMPPLAPADARLCLRGALGDGLGEEQRRRLERLRLRGGGDSLDHHVSFLADAWRRGTAAFDQARDELVKGAAAIRPEQLHATLARRALPASGDDHAERWSLLALLASGIRRQEASWDEEAAAAWRALVPRRDLAGFLAGFDRAAAPVVAPVLGPYVTAAAREEVAAGAVEPGWEPYLAWLHGNGLEVGPLADAVEAAADGAPGPARLGTYRLLERALRSAGRVERALALLRDKELPALAPAAAAERVGEAVAWLVARRGGNDPALTPWLADPRLAPLVLSALAGELERRPEPGAWQRCESLLAAAEGVVPVPAAAAGGGLLGALAGSPLAHRIPAACELLARAAEPGVDPGEFVAASLGSAASHLLPVTEGPLRPTRLGYLVAAIGGLLKVRAGAAGACSADAALMSLAVRALVLADALDALARRRLAPPAPAAGETVVALRSAWPGFLRAALAGGLLDGAVPQGEKSGPAIDPTEAACWQALLADELAARPPDDAESDPRYAALLRLAWQRWLDAPEEPPEARPAGFAVRRVLGLGRIPAEEGWHRALAEEMVPMPLLAKALDLLDLAEAATTPDVLVS